MMLYYGLFRESNEQISSYLSLMNVPPQMEIGVLMKAKNGNSLDLLSMPLSILDFMLRLLPIVANDKNKIANFPLMFNVQIVITGFYLALI